MAVVVDPGVMTSVRIAFKLCGDLLSTINGGVGGNTVVSDFGGDFFILFKNC